MSDAPYKSGLVILSIVQPLKPRLHKPSPLKGGIKDSR